MNEARVINLLKATEKFLIKLGTCSRHSEAMEYKVYGDFEGENGYALLEAIQEELNYNRAADELLEIISCQVTK